MRKLFTSLTAEEHQAIKKGMPKLTVQEDGYYVATWPDGRSGAGVTPGRAIDASRRPAVET